MAVYNYCIVAHVNLVTISFKNADYIFKLAIGLLLRSTTSCYLITGS